MVQFLILIHLPAKDKYFFVSKVFYKFFRSKHNLMISHCVLSSIRGEILSSYWSVECRPLISSSLVQIEDQSEVDGRVTGTEKQFLDQAVHELLSEDTEAPPPPYSTTDYSARSNLSTNTLSVAESPRPKKKSEIRTLLDATAVQADDHKPQWMRFHSSQSHDSGVDNPAYEPEHGAAAAARVLPWKREDQEVFTVTDHRCVARIIYIGW